MSDKPVEQVFSDLFRYLEVLETQNGAMLQLLKDKGVVSDEQFAPYLEKAATASDVKWRAARVRMEHLFASVSEQIAKKTETTTNEPPKKEPPAQEPQKNIQDRAQSKEEAETGARGESRPRGFESAEDHLNVESRPPRTDHPEANTGFGSQGATDAGLNSSNQTAPSDKPTASTASDQVSHNKEAAFERAPEEGAGRGQSSPDKKKEVVGGSDRQGDCQAKPEQQSDNEAA